MSVCLGVCTSSEFTRVCWRLRRHITLFASHTQIAYRRNTRFSLRSPNSHIPWTPRPMEDVRTLGDQFVHSVALTPFY